MKPGIYHDLSNEEYHASNGISKSGISLMLKSPAHYAARYIFGEQQEPTPAMEFGSAVHAFILEPELFAEEWVVPPKVDRRTKAGKQKWADFLAENEGRRLLPKEDLEVIEAMQASVMNHPAAARLIDPALGTAEVSVYWQDVMNEVLCKCRPDFLRDDMVVVDLKTCVDASPEGFARACANFGYHIQAAFYMDGISVAMKSHCRAFSFIAVEKTPPYAVAVYTLDQEAIDAGRLICKSALRQYAQCLRDDDWPGYSERIREISLPRWAMMNI